MGDKGDFLIVFSIVVLIAVGNVLIYFNETKAGVSGLSIMEISNRVKSLDFSTIAFIAQWILILAIVLVFYIKFLKRKKAEDKNGASIKVERERGKKSTTDLDELYELLTERKNLKISVISKSFKVDKDKALEWGKILEEHNLASIEYPAFSEPELIIK